MITRSMINDCLASPVRSRKHIWVGRQQYEYDRLFCRGRRLYDNLRTKYNASHEDAVYAAAQIFGMR